MKKELLAVAGTALVACTGNLPARTPHEKAPSDRPNIIMFLVDDMGWMDCSVNGSTFYNTPNMERLAEQGKIFNCAYTNPLSAPSRCSIMTGKACERNGITTASGPAEPNGNLPLFNHKAAPHCKVIPPTSRNFLPFDQKVMPEWMHELGYATCHIGKWHLGKAPYLAKNHGYDQTIASGHDAWPPSYYPPYRLPDLEDGDDPDKYLTDRLTEEALKYIEEHKDGPFFLNLWHYSVHGPFQAPKEYVDKYVGKVNPEHPQSPVMGAMIEKMDESLGRVMDKLEELGIAENTVLFFFSDNGGEIHKSINGIPVTDCYPLRAGKATIYEGGIRVPCIVSWPGHIKPGTECNVPIVSYDILPTFVDLAGGRTPNTFDYDGISIKPLLMDEGKWKRKGVVVMFPHYTVVQKNVPAIACMDGRWKLIKKFCDGPDRTDSYELYDLENDISESVNLAAQHPEIVKRLEKQIFIHQSRTGFPELPLNPAYDPSAPFPSAKAETKQFLIR